MGSIKCIVVLRCLKDRLDRSDYCASLAALRLVV